MGLKTRSPLPGANVRLHRIANDGEAASCSRPEDERRASAMAEDATVPTYHDAALTDEGFSHSSGRRSLAYNPRLKSQCAALELKL